MIVRLILRALRSSVSTAVAGFIAAHQADPRYLAAAPLLALLGKFLREKYPSWASVVPF